MQHLSEEAIARLVDEAPAMGEALHLDMCEECRSELEAMLEQTRALEALPEAAQPLASLLRSDDAGLRNGAVEALQAMPEAVRPLLPGLLADGDADVRILAVEVVRCLPAIEVEKLLCGVLEHEDDPNVCTAAVEILAEVGTAEAIPTLRRLAGRFPSQPMLPFAVRIAIERIAGSGT